MDDKKAIKPPTTTAKSAQRPQSEEPSIIHQVRKATRSRSAAKPAEEKEETPVLLKEAHQGQRAMNHNPLSLLSQKHREQREGDEAETIEVPKDRSASRARSAEPPSVPWIPMRESKPKRTRGRTRESKPIAPIVGFGVADEKVPVEGKIRSASAPTKSKRRKKEDDIMREIAARTKMFPGQQALAAPIPLARARGKGKAKAKRKSDELATVM